MGIQDALIKTVRKRASVHEKARAETSRNTANKEILNINFSNIFFKSYTFDDKDHPIYIFDSTYLPNMSKISNDKQLYDVILDKLIQKLIQKLPKNKKFSLIIFSSGFKNLNWKWTMGIKIYSKLINDINNYKLENDDKLIIYKMYIVHESLWVRTLFQIWQQFKLGQVLNEKENDLNIDDSFVLDEENDKYQSVPSSSIFETLYLNDLSELAQYVDITKLRISLNVYLYDLNINEYIELPSSYHNSMNTANGIKLNRDFRQAMFEKIYERLTKESVENELVFYKQGDKKKVDVMVDVINRNNYCDISQWDIYTLATVFIWFLTNKKKIFFPLEMIRSCKDLAKYVNNDTKFSNIRFGFSVTFKLFKKMMEYHCYYNLVKFIIPLFLNMIKHYGRTRHNFETVTEVLVTPLCKPNKDSSTYQKDKNLGKMFIINVLTHFDSLVEQYEDLEKQSNSQVIKLNEVTMKTTYEKTESLEAKPKLDNRPVPHLANIPVSRQVSTKQDVKTPSKQAPKLPNPRKSSTVLSPVKNIESFIKKEYAVSPTKRQIGGASNTKIEDFYKPNTNFSLGYGLELSASSNNNTSVDSENDITNFPITPPTLNLEELRGSSNTLNDYSDDDALGSPGKSLSPPVVFTKPLALKSEKNMALTRCISESAETYEYSNIVLSPIKIREISSLKTSSRNLSSDSNSNLNNAEKIINGHGTDEDVWEYVITKKENNKLIRDVSNIKNFEKEMSSKKNQEPKPFISAIDPKLSKDRKVSNLIMLFEERSEGYNMIKELKKNGSFE